jgi:hypothetical protein
MIDPRKAWGWVAPRFETVASGQAVNRPQLEAITRVHIYGSPIRSQHTNHGMKQALWPSRSVLNGRLHTNRGRLRALSSAIRLQEPESKRPALPVRNIPPNEA